MIGINDPYLRLDSTTASLAAYGYDYIAVLFMVYESLLSKCIGSHMDFIFIGAQICHRYFSPFPCWLKPLALQVVVQTLLYDNQSGG